MNRVMISNLNKYQNKNVVIKGFIHRIRRLKKISFIILRDRTGLMQCVVDNEKLYIDKIKLESVVSIEGCVKESKNTLSHFEVQVENLIIINEPVEDLPIEINKENLEINLDTKLNNRMLSLRHEKVSSIFKIENIIANGFRKFLNNNGFTEISTPKIVNEGAEGGSEVFKLKYFEKNAYLAQSPQFYKQMMVGAGFERVFEISHVYRAEEHNTTRHLNEYVSMDLEMGFIEDEKDIMDLEEELLKFILDKVKIEGKKYLELLNAEIPIIENTIPRMKFSEAIEILKNEYNKVEESDDMDTEGEKLICQYIKEKYNSDFVFLTHYPRKKRPMYTMPCGEDETHSFDLLFRGLEITTGGQRIHEYNMLIENMKYKGFNPQNYESYISNFKYGMMPHGGLAIGLERITCRMLGIENVREGSLIPRDRTRLLP
ncbi:aspartate--tRNA(Asn) ligase [Clostridium botulinum]|uniref:Aspartate--tRNA ligase n=1 Tax=Clostridium botulinum (strain Eklund 17B / Type B) TaxID=935198 RepID=B2TN88_CLOBB|nr:aspartate--tRNA ligase [Clostridium botulinum B str. Eklund 17B (NRP)]MBY6976025.1 aspartate--tRNA(Asn) ligase [Clostridium botulinum]MBY7000448.1 aspartate--tRNA(Asn) ligase [Clostridium botulinum]MCR1273208.1 aspartate--tRNA(Asn) ligase [Clostridium botulinum]NFD70308.1 aspartate--tRNA(Asn) ligase [Clostridium botulinum]